MSKTEQTMRDIAFLNEFYQFTSHGPVVVAKTLYEALTTAHHNSDFYSVAHLQLRLYAEMIQSIETYGAHLYAYSKWNDQSNILNALFEYRPGDVPKFIKKLNSAPNPLQLLCLTEEVTPTCPKDREQLQEEILDACRLCTKEFALPVYNKIKHAGMYIRSQEVLSPHPSRVAYHSDVTVMNCKKNKWVFASFEVTGKDGLILAEKHYHNTKVIMKTARSLAAIFSNCLENGLLRPSKSCDD